MLKSSTGEVGTLLTIIFFPSVDPIPTDAHERTDPASENGFPLIPYPESKLLGGLLDGIPESVNSKFKKKQNEGKMCQWGLIRPVNKKCNKMTTIA